MSRESRWNSNHSSNSVETIEISDKKLKLRFWLTVILLAVGIIMIAISLAARLRAAEGWQEITANTSAQTHCGGDFVFLYNIDGKNESTPHKKQLISLYTDACIKGYQIFNADSEFENVGNIATLNKHPNETVTVHPVLYRALEKLVAADCRYIFLRPADIQYDNLFLSKSSDEAENFDPFVNEEMRQYYLEIAAFAGEKEDISIELLGDFQVKLHLSERVLSYSKENEIDGWVDLYWLENAFIIDYIADRLRAEGFYNGCISSYDGFSVSLGEMQESLSVPVYDRKDNVVTPVAELLYTKPTAFVSFRDYPLANKDGYLYYEIGNGIFRTRFIDYKDGICKTAEDSLIFCSENKGCADIAIAAAPIFISDTLRQTEVNALISDGIYAVYSDGESIINNYPAVRFGNAKLPEK